MDARGSDLQFQPRRLREGSYVLVEPDADGWIWSDRLRHFFRLTRRRTPRGSWWYTLESRGA